MERKKINGVTVSFQGSTLKNPATILSQRLQLNSILCSEDKSKFLILAQKRSNLSDSYLRQSKRRCTSSTYSGHRGCNHTIARRRFSLKELRLSRTVFFLLAILQEYS